MGGNGEVVLNNRSGYLVPSRDAEVLAVAMMKMMALSEAERRAMGEAGRAYVEANYSLEHVVDQWEALYKSLLAQKRV